MHKCVVSNKDDTLFCKCAPYDRHELPFVSDLSIMYQEGGVCKYR